MTGGPDTALRIAHMWADAFPDGTLEVRRVYTQGDVAIGEEVGRGTHKGEFSGVRPTGRPVEVVICRVLELRDGRVYRERQYLDMLSVLTQIGALKAPGRAAGA
jgi:predicted ester cyclase